MSTDSADILTAALALPEGERLDIAHRLFASVPPPNVLSEDDPNFAEKFTKRLEYRDEDLIDHDEAMRRLRASLANTKREGKAS